MMLGGKLPFTAWSRHTAFAFGFVRQMGPEHLYEGEIKAVKDGVGVMQASMDKGKKKVCPWTSGLGDQPQR